jgi:mitofusin
MLMPTLPCSLSSAIDSTSAVVGSLREFAQHHWIMTYPETERDACATAAAAAGPSSSLRRSQSTTRGESLDDAAATAQLEAERAARSSSSTVQHPGMQRGFTCVGVPSSSAPTTPVRKTPTRAETTPLQRGESSGEMSVLRLDLKLGAASNNPRALVQSLEKSSIAQLLDGRMAQSQRQLQFLQARIADKQSKVLVTGDLNAGKSTLVNALLRRAVMPTDQQPCTTVFCEVLDADEANEGREEVHVLKSDAAQYDRLDESTFSRHSLQQVEQIVADAEDVSPENAPLLKCYCRDTRASQQSLLRNGVVDIALIDAPGLNRDSLKTTALFARQEEIDVVVFVVSAENHFTLSAKEFLWNASNDKAYVFIVVNKYDQIRNKEKCRRLVLEQIKQLSPRTYEDADELVHFVDSSAVLDEAAAPDEEEPQTPGEDTKVGGSAASASSPSTLSSASSTSFAQLEASLRDFVLLKRSKSKLMPAQTYLLRLLLDLAFVARTNVSVAETERAEALQKLAAARPALAQSEANHVKLETQLEGEEEGVVSGVMQGARARLQQALDLVGNGQSADVSVTLPAYPGLLNVLQYAQDVRQALLCSLEASLCNVEEAARAATTEAVQRVRALGETHLPEGANRSQRVFQPETMFRQRRARSFATTTTFVGLGVPDDMVDVKITDLFDLPHVFKVVAGRSAADEERGSKKAALEQESSLTGGLTLGLGALTLVGGKTLGAKTAIEAFVRLSDLVGNPTARRWAGPLLAIATTGLVVYFVVDLPNSIPRNAGRSIRHELSAAPMGSRKAIDAQPTSTTIAVSSTAAAFATSSSSSSSSSATSSLPAFIEYHSKHTADRTRKVLRLISWELHELFTVHIAACKAEVHKAETQQKSAESALSHFHAMTARIEDIERRVQAVGLLQH